MAKRFLIFPWLFSLLSFHLVAGSFTFTTIGSASTQAHGINDSGQVVGRYFDGVNHDFSAERGHFQHP